MPSGVRGLEKEAGGRTDPVQARVSGSVDGAMEKVGGSGVGQARAFWVGRWRPKASSGVSGSKGYRW